jgi:Acetyltransferase (GNAT) domain
VKATLVDPGAPEWDDTLARAPHDFYHLPAYVSLCAAHEKGLPRGLHVTDGRRSVLLPLIVRPIPGHLCDAESPYGYPGPVSTDPADDAFLGRALIAGWRILRASGAVTAFVRLHPLLNPRPPEGAGAVVRHGATVSIDLTLDPDVIWTQMRLNHRRDIARARRLGYTTHIDEEWRHLADFTRLYRATMGRHAADGFYFFDDGYFAGLRDALGQRLRLWVVERDDAVVCAGLFAETNGILQYHLSGSDEAHRDAQPTKLMIDTVRRWGQSRGDTVFHLGGGLGGATDTLFHFKAGFSPRRHEFSTLRVVLDRDANRRLALAHDLGLDPDDAGGYFPAYRRG